MLNASKTTLAEYLNTTPKTIQRLLKELEELGALLIINRRMESNRKTSNLYIMASINPKTGDFESNSLDQFRYLKENAIKVKGK